MSILYSLGGIFDTPIFIFYKGTEPLERLPQLRGKHLYLSRQAMREVHGAPGPFNRLGEFPAEQAGDLPFPDGKSVLPVWPDFLAGVHVVLAHLTA